MSRPTNLPKLRARIHQGDWGQGLGSGLASCYWEAALTAREASQRKQAGKWQDLTPATQPTLSMGLFTAIAIIAFVAAIFFAVRSPHGNRDELVGDDTTSGTLEHLIVNLSIDEPPKQLDWKFRTDGTGKSYFHVNLADISCTCDSFTNRRNRFASNDIRRFCGHIIRGYEKSGVWPKAEGIVATLLASGPPEGGCWAYDDISRTKLSSGEYIYFGKRNSRDWVDVYARGRRKGDVRGKYTGNYGRYGFNMAGKNWSFGSAPPGAREIRTILAAI